MVSWRNWLPCLFYILKRLTERRFQTKTLKSKYPRYDSITIGKVFGRCILLDFFMTIVVRELSLDPAIGILSRNRSG
jgi:hypothetical protein